MHILVLDHITINLDEEDTLENQIIDIDVDLLNMFSTQLTLTCTPNYNDSSKSLSLDLAIIPIKLDIPPLVIYLPSLVTTD